MRYDPAQIEGFDWDPGNRGKNERKHNVTDEEAEELFFNVPFLTSDDVGHGDTEKRFQALGRTKNGRQLFVAFTLRAGGGSSG